MAEADLYNKGNIRITDASIILGWYYFPIGTKTINFADIERVEEKELTMVGFNYKTWGMGFDMKVWWHLDCCMRELNSNRHRALILHIRNSKTAAGITPVHDDYEKVKALIVGRVNT